MDRKQIEKTSLQCEVNLQDSSLKAHRTPRIPYLQFRVETMLFVFKNTTTPLKWYAVIKRKL